MSMWDLDGWVPIACSDRDTVMAEHPEAKPWSSLTDLSGEFGEPIVFTEWGTDKPILRDYRWPNSERKCEHYAPEVER